MTIFETIKNYIIGVTSITVVNATFLDVLQFIGIIAAGLALVVITGLLVAGIVKCLALTCKKTFHKHQKATDKIICPRCGKPFSACVCADTISLTAKQKLAAFKKRNKLVKKSKKLAEKSK